MRWSCFAICLGLTLELPTRAGFGWVQTVDGANLSGELQLSNNVLIVTSTNPAPSLVGITNLRAARFDAPGETSGIASGGHGHGLLGYYFSNTNLHATSACAWTKPSTSTGRRPNRRPVWPE